MLEEQKSLILKNFPDLVRNCDMQEIMRSLSMGDPTLNNIIDNIKIEEDHFHNNRIILFQIMKTSSPHIFTDLVKSLRKHNHDHLADKLENKPTSPSPHKTSPFTPPEQPYIYVYKQLKVEVTVAKQFCDTGSDCYRTRSRNRGKVLIINNIVFDTICHPTRLGAEVDESNLKQLFEEMGLDVDIHRNLSGEEMKAVTESFAKQRFDVQPDLGIVIMMSHGDSVNNKTVIYGSDGRQIEESSIVQLFSNRDCAIFRNRPKILIFNICRGELFDELNFAQHTQFDSVCNLKPDEGDDRYYSDLMICHPSVEGFRAHRNTVKGCWYIELICQIFMDRSHEVDVETMLKIVAKELKERISERNSKQTCTYLNIAFKTCFLNPGIYEEGGDIVQFKQL